MIVNRHLQRGTAIFRGARKYIDYAETIAGRR